MSVIYVLLAISLSVAIIFFIAFIVSVRSGQYDDSYTPSVRMLFEDELVLDKRKENEEKREENEEKREENKEKRQERRE
ncbi:MAG TPA: cbb3-type cytochrome oxidase assembly protein CcoS [Pricia sp.]|nr:cbb3-type cytochrome oxidase assembly protein CcoS [Pricia sp.]